MYKLIIFIFLLLGSFSFSQEMYYTTAKNGLIIREKPDTKSAKINKISIGYEFELIEKTGIKYSFLENKQSTTGEWIKIKFVDPYNPTESFVGYVVDYFIEKKETRIASIKKMMDMVPKFKDYSLEVRTTPFYIKGDFFSNAEQDIAVPDEAFLVKDSNNVIKIVIIYEAIPMEFYFLGGEEDPFGHTNYNWVSVFERVPAATVLWSNYTDDFRSFEEVPDNEKVILPYDAIYVHAAESCGGGYIYWNREEGKFNWLQQE